MRREFGVREDGEAGGRKRRSEVWEVCPVPRPRRLKGGVMPLLQPDLSRPV